MPVKMGPQAIGRNDLRQMPQLSPAWRPASAATSSGDRTAGARAASRGIDGAVAVETFMRKLMVEGGQELGRLQGQCRKILGASKNKLEQLQRTLDVDLTARVEINNRQHDEQIVRLHNEIGPGSSNYSAATSRSEQAESLLRDLRWHLGGRPLQSRFRGWYVGMLLILALVAFPLNRAPIETLFSGQALLFFLSALAVGFALMFAAHTVGRILRIQPQQMTGWIIAGKILGTAILAASVGLGVYAMARMRQTYMTLLSQENAGFAARLRDALQDRVAAAPEPVQLPAGSGFTSGDWIFIVANLGLFAIGVALSYLRHDPDKDYERAVVAAERAQKRLAAITARHDQKAMATTKHFLAIKRDLDAQIGEARAAVAALHSQEADLQAHMEGARGLVAMTIRTRCGSFVYGFNEVGNATGPALQIPTLEEISRQLTMGSLAHVA